MPIGTLSNDLAGEESSRLAKKKWKHFASWMNGVNEPLISTLIDAAAFLRSELVPFALIGGFASTLLGQPRLTADVDLVIEADVDRVLGLVSTLPQSMFEPLFDGVEEVVQRSFILPILHRRNRVKVDIAIGLTGFEHLAVRRARPILIAGQPIPVATPEDLLLMKVLAGRPQDEQDIEGLLVTQKRTLDWKYCERVARELGEALGADLLTRINQLREKRVD